MDLDAYLQQMLAGPDPAAKKAALAQALAASGLATLAGRNGGGWQGALRSAGQGGLLGMGAYNQAMGDAAQAPAHNLDAIGKVMGLKAQQQQMEDAAKQREKRGRMDALAASSMSPGYAPFQSEDREGNAMQMPGAAPSFDAKGYGRGLFGIDPMEAMKWQQAQAKDSPLDKFKPEHYTPQSLARFQASQNANDLEMLQKPKDQWVTMPGGRNGQILQRNTTTGEIRAAGSPGTNISISNKLESAESVAKGQQNVKYYGDLKTSADTALKENAILQRLISNPLETGAGVPIVGAAANWASFAGLGGDKVKEYATNSQNFTRDTMELVMNRQLAQKGPQTESDAKRLEATVANAKNTREANAAIAQFALAQNNRLIEQRKFYDKWWLTKKTYEGADEAWFDGRGGTSVWDDVPGAGAPSGALPDGVTVRRTK